MHHSTRPTLAAVFLATLSLATAAGAATLVVDAAGSGDFETLEAAIAVAVDGDVIQVRPGVYPTSVVIEASLTIEGLGAAEDVVFNGQGNARIMLLQGEQTVSLRQLTFRDGYGDSGGAILSWQGMDLTIEDCRFIDNRADWGGGAIEARSPTGSLVIRDCLFDGNHAGNHAGGLAVMFGIDAEVDGCTFLRNTATVMAAAFTANTAGNVDIHHCQFLENVSGMHGAIYLVYTGSCEVRHCTIWGTVAGGHGAILIQSSALSLHHNIIGGTVQGGGLAIHDGGFVTASCNIYWDNDGGDVIGGILQPDEWHEDPQLCDPDAGDLAPCETSLAVVGTDCGLMGALPPGCPCGVVRVEARDWSEIKAMFR